MMNRRFGRTSSRSRPIRGRSPGRSGGRSGLMGDGERGPAERVELQPVKGGSRRIGARELPVRPPAVRPRAINSSGGSRRERHDPDWVIVVAVVALAAVGVLMVYSASALASYSISGNTYKMLAPQIVAGLIGLVAMIALSRADYRVLRDLSIVLAIVAGVLLVLVLAPGIGVERNGSSRWIRVGPFFEFAPSEVAKLVLAIYLAHWLDARGTRIKSFWAGTVPYWIIVGPFVLLVALEPDLGTTGIVGLIALSLYFIAGARIRHLAMVVAGAAGAGWALVNVTGAYPMARIQAFLDPWADSQGAGYHTLQALQALGAGGLLGTGLGNGRVFVPNDFNDYIFSTIAQELGFVGGMVVIGLFVAFAWGGIRTALRAPDTFGGLLAAGITAWITFQAIINICVVLALMPVTGITLPFVSQGGSSLVVNFAAVGVLLSISRETVERGWVNASADSGRGNGRAHLPGPRRSAIPAGTTGGA
jgi:cell division protein FtsW